jgi:hypothetical protein
MCFLGLSTDLRQINPDWFNALTVKASNEENNRTGLNQPRPAHGGEGFKTPFGKNAVDSQPFSTPKIFRHSRSLLSPDPQHDGSFIEQGYTHLLDICTIFVSL